MAKPLKSGGRSHPAKAPVKMASLKNVKGRRFNGPAPTEAELAGIRRRSAAAHGGTSLDEAHVLRTWQNVQDRKRQAKLNPKGRADGAQPTPPARSLARPPRPAGTEKARGVPRTPSRAPAKPSGQRKPTMALQPKTPVAKAPARVGFSETLPQPLRLAGGKGPRDEMPVVPKTIKRRKVSQ